MLRYSDRAALSSHPLAKRLFHLIEEKHTNLAVAADLDTTDALLKCADDVGPSICVFKTHIDIVNDFTPQTAFELRRLSEKHNFLLFEDRKFADIGNTVLNQYQGGIYKISSWAHLTNAHSIFGPGLIDGLRQGGLPHGNGLMLLAQLSAKGNLITSDYTQQTVDLADRYPDFVVGFISQEKVSQNPAHIHMTPGVQLAAGGDNLGQQYNTPHHIIIEKRCDIIIVGRGILSAPCPRAAAETYRHAGWSAYQQRMVAYL